MVRLAPGAPLLIPEECSAENNSVTVAWQAPQGYGPGQRAPAIEGYLLELDDGCGGEFRVSWSSPASASSLRAGLPPPASAHGSAFKGRRGRMFRQFRSARLLRKGIRVGGLLRARLPPARGRRGSAPASRKIDEFSSGAGLIVST